MNWEYLLQKISKSYYTECIMEFSSLLVVVIYLIMPKKSKSMGWLAFNRNMNKHIYWSFKNKYQFRFIKGNLIPFLLP